MASQLTNAKEVHSCTLKNVLTLAEIPRVRDLVNLSDKFNKQEKISEVLGTRGVLDLRLEQ